MMSAIARLQDTWRDNQREANLFALIVAVFLAIYFLPAGQARFDNAVLEAFRLTHWYAQEHVILCLLPAFLIAGGMATYISQGAVMRYLGPTASKWVALPVASSAGMLLAVCSCTVLPLFGGIYRRGAGLGAAIAFLYSGPAINIMAVVVTAKVLGPELGIARAVGAMVFAVVIGFLMHLIYRREESERNVASTRGFEADESARPGRDVFSLFALMVAILIFANWAPVGEGVWLQVAQWKWQITVGLSFALAALLAWRWQWPVSELLIVTGAVGISAFLVPNSPQLPFALGVLGLMVIAARRPDDRAWATESWDFAKQILPLLAVGVFVAGFALGRPGHEGIIPGSWVAAAVGDESLRSVAIASVLGALMYFSTLTEVPIVDALMGAGMGKGPALALLLAGPALSLPNMLVIRTILGSAKTLVYCTLVVVFSTFTGFIYGNFW